jgi:GMP synthase-like glutamine amidotransferase
MIYFILHSPYSPPGSTLEWCKENQRPYRLLELYNGHQFPDKISKEDRFVFCGGLWKPNESLLWLNEEKKFIERCIAENYYMLGMCFGAQLIAEAFGTPLHMMPDWEIGWWDTKIKSRIKSTDQKLATTSLNATEFETLKVFLWHRYAFCLPRGAEPLAKGEYNLVQGFRVNSNIIGLQFHAHATLSWIKECMELRKENYPEGKYVQNETQIVQLSVHLGKMKSWYFALLNDFM